MINLLPPQEKRRLYWERQLKIVVIIEVLIISCLLVLWLSFLAVKINIKTQKEIAENALNLEESKVKQINEIKNEIKDINQTFRKVNQIYENQVLVSDILFEIMKLLPQDAYLESFVFENKKIQIIGKIQSLESLNQLKEKLKREESFKDVEFSIGSYVPGKEIEFRTKITLK